MSDPSVAAFDLVSRAAAPFAPRDSDKAKVRRAAERLGAHGLDHSWSKCWRAWQGRSAAGSYLEIKAAFDRWRASEAAEARREDAEVAEQFARLAEAMNASDAEFYSPAIEALRAVIGAKSSLVRRDGGQN